MSHEQQELAQGGYSREEVIAELHRSGRRIWFRYELLDKDGRHVRWLDDHVVSGKVTNRMFADIKRIAEIRLRTRLDLEITTQRIKPWFYLEMRRRVVSFSSTSWATLAPTWDEMDTIWASIDEDLVWEYDELRWPLGVFMIASPKSQLSERALLGHDMQLFDQMLILRDWRVEDRYSLESGTNITAAVREILRFVGFRGSDIIIPGSEHTLPADKEWAIGTSFAEIVNDLLDSMNYNSLSFNGHGKAYSYPYQRPDERHTDYTYQTDDRSIIHPAATYEFDWFGVANHWIAVVSNPDVDEPLISTFTNDSPGNPLSTVNMQRVITDFRDDLDVVSQEALDSYVERLAFEASQIYQRAEIDTLLMPMHENGDLIRVVYPRLNRTNDRFVETDWEMELEVGGKMSHKLRKLVSLHG